MDNRDALRRLEDRYIRLYQAKMNGKILTGIDLDLCIIKQMIRMQKKINELPEEE